MEWAWFGGVKLMRMGCVRVELSMWTVRRSVEIGVEVGKCMWREDDGLWNGVVMTMEGIVYWKGRKVEKKSGNMK